MMDDESYDACGIVQLDRKLDLERGSMCALRFETHESGFLSHEQELNSFL